MDSKPKVRIENLLETKWRCWRCKAVCKMGECCLNCNKYLQDYPYDDFQALLVYVRANTANKIHRSDRKKSEVKFMSQKFTALRCNELKCKKCSDLLYTDASEYCHRCRPKCEECNFLYVLKDNIYCEDCTRKKREAKHFETIERAVS